MDTTPTPTEQALTLVAGICTERLTDLRSTGKATTAALLQPQIQAAIDLLGKAITPAAPTADKAAP